MNGIGPGISFPVLQCSGTSCRSPLLVISETRRTILSKRGSSSSEKSQSSWVSERTTWRSFRRSTATCFRMSTPGRAIYELWASRKVASRSVHHSISHGRWHTWPGEYGSRTDWRASRQRIFSGKLPTYTTTSTLRIRSVKGMDAQRVSSSIYCCPRLASGWTGSELIRLNCTMRAM